MLHILHFYTFLRGIRSKLVNALLLVAILILPAFPAVAEPPNPRLVKDINPGLSGSYNQNNYRATINGIHYFAPIDGAHGRELWRTDGTEGGTFLVKDINPGPYDSYPRWMTNVNGTLVFVADDSTRSGGLWKSDGTEGGTFLVKDIYSCDWLVTSSNGVLVFNAADDTHGWELWKSDGTTAGTVLVKDINPGIDDSMGHSAIEINGAFFFSARDGSHGYELWKSDGTEAATVMVKDIVPGPDGSEPGPLINFNGTLFAQTDAGWYRSDGTEAGTVKVSFDRQQLSGFVEVNGTALFIDWNSHGDGDELWKTDFTAEGTVMVKDIYPGRKDSFPNLWDSLNMNGTLYFSAANKYGRELWKTDGTKAGTKLVRDIYPGAKSSMPRGIVNANGSFYFSAVNNNKYGRELWKSNGTKSSTKLVADIATGRIGADPHAFVLADNLLFFYANDVTHGDELWVLDLTKPITAMTEETLIDAAADVEVPEESISDAEAEAVYQAELAAYEAELAQAGEEVADAEALSQKVFLPLIAR